MQVNQLKELLTHYLNRDKVSYKFYTERWFMEITIRLQNISVHFAVEQRETLAEGLKHDLFVLEPSGYTKIIDNVSFDLDDSINLLNHIAAYFKNLALFLQKTSFVQKPSDRRIIVKETSVTGDEHQVVYYNDFLSVLHAAGYIETDYVETHDGDSNLVSVFVVPAKVEG